MRFWWKNGVFGGFRGEKGGYFEGFTLIGDGFWINRGVCRGNAGKGGCMSGAAARTGDLIRIGKINI